MLLRSKQILISVAGILLSTTLQIKYGIVSLDLEKSLSAVVDDAPWPRPPSPRPNESKSGTTTEISNNQTKERGANNSNILDADGSERVPVQTPTNRACDGVDGILHIMMAPSGAAGATVFFQFVVGQIIYAERHNLKPWVHMSNVVKFVYDEEIHSAGSIQFTAMVGRKPRSLFRRKLSTRQHDIVPGSLDKVQDKQTVLDISGTGVWEHYFEPVSDFVPGDSSCTEKLYTTLRMDLLANGIHKFAEWAPRCWRYPRSPPYLNKPHLPQAEWFENQRIIGNRAVHQYIRPRRYLLDRSEQVNGGCTIQSPCLGLHIRHSDKSSHRRVVLTAEFLPYVEAFLRNGGAHVYVATDSSLVTEEINASWPSHVVAKVRTIGNDVVRSSNKSAVFDIGQHHRTNVEILTEIYALSKCQFLVHGLSAVSEAAVWINLDLHWKSVNLEDSDALTSTRFGTLVEMASKGEPASHLPRGESTNFWWKTPRVSKVIDAVATPVQCDSRLGFLRISAVGNQQALGPAMLRILYQLRYAEDHNLVPWVSLDPESSQLLFDKEEHNSTTSSMLYSAVNGGGLSVERNQKTFFLGPPQNATNHKTAQRRAMKDGIWSSYLAPGYTPGDTSCDWSVFELPISSKRKSRLDTDLQKLLRDQPVHSHDSQTRMNTSTASFLVKKHFRLAAYLVDRVDVLLPNEAVDSGCLAIYVGDTTGTLPSPFFDLQLAKPYIQEFLRAGGRHVYLSSPGGHSDFHQMESLIHETVHADTSNQTSSVQVHSQGRWVVRSAEGIPTYDMDEDRHRINSESFVDIWAISRCRVVLAPEKESAWVELATAINPSLQSVFLKDRQKPSSTEIVDMVWPEDSSKRI